MAAPNNFGNSFLGGGNVLSTVGQRKTGEDNINSLKKEIDKLVSVVQNVHDFKNRMASTNVNSDLGMFSSNNQVLTSSPEHNTNNEITTKHTSAFLASQNVNISQMSLVLKNINALKISVEKELGSVKEQKLSAAPQATPKLKL